MLEIKNLHVAVEGKEILKGLSLSIAPGEVHAIMGPNGSGKSTLSYVLAGRAGYDITEGSIVYNGEDLVALVRALGLERVHLAGISYGAYTVLLTTLRHPEVVRSAILVEPPLMGWAPDLPGGAGLAEEFKRVWRATGDAFRGGDREGALRISIDWFLGPGATDNLPPEFAAMLRGNLEEWRALTTSTDAFPAVSRDDVRALSTPVLMISGGRTMPILKLTDDELEEQLQGERRVTVPDGTHDVCSEQPPVGGEAIRAFLSQ